MKFDYTIQKNKSKHKVPARYEEHYCTFISWPCVGDSEIDLFRKEIVNFAKTVSKYEKVIIIADPLDSENVKKECEDFSTIWEIPNDMSWIRDNGPIFVRNSKNEIVAIHYEFNGWGDKYRPYEKVRKIPSFIAKKLNIECFKSNLIVEGGGVSFDGDDTVITTEQMLMNKNRNSKFSRNSIEHELELTLGIKKVIWLKKGLVEDIGTDGHVDCVVEYVAPGKIIAQGVHDKNNPNYEILKNNMEILNKEKDAKGRKLDIIEMPYLPYFPEKYKGDFFVSPYTNYYIVNNAILVPKVNPKTDDFAYQIIEKIYPKRKIEPVDSFYQAIGGGGPGCLTQQLPIGNNISIS